MESIFLAFLINENLTKDAKAKKRKAAGFTEKKGLMFTGTVVTILVKVL